ncbi:hypothetical protein NITLEN_60176 [Nitrospira lenta]|uniref:Uncharacterized protein n=1 Tax=Nitrospira lenta TaxID=1436998 RepID=A0A330L8S4_9BACT|nr:hypothetical protein NITLEN_60176 [Nitrospira lenta]
MLNLGRPEDRGKCEGKTQPEFLAKHRHGMARVAIVALVVVRHLVTSMWVRRLSGICVCHQVHGALRSFPMAVLLPRVR